MTKETRFQIQCFFYTKAFPICSSECNFSTAKSCKYPENVINRAFRNARPQGPAPLKTNSNNIPFVTTYYDNVNNNEKVKKIRRKFNDIQSDHLKNVFKNSNIILAQKQPKNLLRLLSKARFNTDTNNFIQLKGYLNVQINAAKFVCCM